MYPYYKTRYNLTPVADISWRSSKLLLVHGKQSFRRYNGDERGREYHVSSQLEGI